MNVSTTKCTCCIYYLFSQGNATPNTVWAPTRNYRLWRNGNLAVFFLYVCNGKKNNELFASTLNEIAASVRCVSSMIIVSNAKLPD